MMTCSECSHVPTAGALFCTECAAWMAQAVALQSDHAQTLAVGQGDLVTLKLFNRSTRPDRGMLSVRASTGVKLNDFNRRNRWQPRPA